MVNQSEQRAIRPNDFIAGHVALDLVNTVTGRNGVEIDMLRDYNDVVRWAKLGRHFRNKELVIIEEAAANNPKAAAVALRELKIFREALYQVLANLITRRRSSVDSIRVLESAWKKATASSRWQMGGSGLNDFLPVREAGLDYFRLALAFSTYELLSSFPAARTRVCVGDNCGWIFIDSSKGGRRRWCDMAVCGNKAKSRRHIRRKKKGAQRRNQN